MTAARPAPRAPTRRYEARRLAIVRLAIEVLNRKGLRGMTLGEVAASLGLVPTAVIYYFRHKEDLACAALSHGLETYESLLAASAGAVTPEARMQAFVHAYFGHVKRVVLGEADPVPAFGDVRPLNNPEVNDAYVAMFRHARDLATDRNSLPPLHCNARAHLFLSQVLWVFAWQHQVETADYHRAADRMAQILTRGFVGSGAAWPKPRYLPLGLEDNDEDDGAALSSSEQFLRAATQLINEEGYHGASVERISAKLNVSKGAFYHHIHAKDDLVEACFQRTLDIIWRAIHEAERGGGTGLEVLAAVVSTLVQHQADRGAPLIRTSALTALPEAIRPALMERFNRISYRFASILSDGISDGSIAPVDVNIASQMITATINAASELHYWTPGLDPRTVVEHYVRPLFEGLISPPAG